ncbi:daunorubicin ABC transporter ATP-binding protein [Thermoplasma sp. Kam2015]|uniref:ABC transporter permease n=1 Tax=Thermoplasma sp. Kam2015 TaxID=2094122 RepID=UPI000D9D25E8|nr:ABC transporter permease [Thermoplasma sp. Kam2015]PYB67967.1 daunorubicin ABC transporter ATP-binding protein [Thermoplasma sp. Kam2015]
MNLKFIMMFAWYYGFRAVRRGPSYLLSAMSTPLALLFLIFIISRGKLLNYALVGGFIGLISSVSLSSAGDAAFLRLQLRMQDLFVATSISPTDYMMGLTLSYLIFSIPGLFVYAFLGGIFHIFTPTGVVALIGTLIMLTLATSSVSFIVSGLIKHVRNVWGIAGILSVVMTVLPPTFYPYTIIPRPFLYALSISPATSAAVIMQGVFGLSPNMYTMIPIFIIETAVYALIGRTMIKWKSED